AVGGPARTRDRGAGIPALRRRHRLPGRHDPPGPALDAARRAGMVPPAQPRATPAGPPLSAAGPAVATARRSRPAHLLSRRVLRRSAQLATPVRPQRKPHRRSGSCNRITERVTNMTTTLGAKTGPLDGSAVPAQPVRAPGAAARWQQKYSGRLRIT